MVWLKSMLDEEKKSAPTTTIKMNKKKRMNERTVRIIYPNATTTYIPPCTKCNGLRKYTFFYACSCVRLCALCMNNREVTEKKKIPMCNITKMYIDDL